MKNKTFLSVLLFSLLLTGCGNESEEAYNNSVQKGLDVLALEDYSKAEVYFELALEEKPKDEKASALLVQTVNYGDALQLFEEESYEEALQKVELIVNSQNGSNAMITKAEVFKKDIQQKVKEPVEVSETEEVDVEEKEEVTETGYTYDDFKGMYAIFESTPYQSPIQYVVLLTDTHLIDGLPATSYLVSNILDKRVKDDLLQIDYFTPESEEDGESSGHIEFQIKYKNNQKILLFTDSEVTGYPITEQQLLDEEWILPPEL